MVSLDKFLKQEKIQVNLKEALVALTKSIIQVSREISQAPLKKNLILSNNQNIHGEKQTYIDVIANKIFINNLKKTKDVTACVSEEMTDYLCFKKKRKKNQLIVFFDPLDGSSNISSNISVGSIFSIYCLDHSNKITKSDFLQPGHKQIASGFSLYGPSTQLVMTTGNGANEFTLNNKNEKFYCSNSKFLIPKKTSEFSINMSNQRFWEKSMYYYIKDCLLGVDGKRKKNFNMRWVASLVADANRILKRGGIYIYPKDRKIPKKEGRLRLMYEINPMAFIVEQAGGLCISGKKRILNIEPNNIHQCIPVAFGSKDEVNTLKRYLL